MKNPKFIYFDLDDTLLDHQQAEHHALRDTRRQFNFFSDISEEQLRQTYHTINSRQWRLYSQQKIGREELQRNRFEQTLEALGLDGSVHQKVGSYYINAYANHWQWVDGARLAFDAIRQKFDVGILTNGFSETQQKKFTQFNLYESARELVISEEVGHLKPHPKVFDHATRLVGHEPEQILYIGDSYASDVVGGTEYGWQVGWFKSNGQTGDRDRPQFVFEHFKELRNYLNV